MTAIAALVLIFFIGADPLGPDPVAPGEVHGEEALRAAELLDATIVSVQSRFREEAAADASSASSDEPATTDAAASSSEADAVVHDEPASFDTMDFDQYE